MRIRFLLAATFALLALPAARADSATELYTKGRAAIDVGKWDEAIDLLNNAITAKPDYARAYWLRAFAHTQKEQYDQSIADLSKADQLEPHNAIFLNNRGDVYRLMEKYDLAIADLTASLQVSKSPGSLTIRGRVYSLKGNQDLAIQDLNRALEMDRNYSAAYLHRGIAYKRKKNYARAIQDYQKAVSLDPTYTDAWNGLGWSYATCPDFTVRNGKKAVECASKACALTRGELPAYYKECMAAAYAENKDFPKAIEWQQKFLADPRLGPKTRKSAGETLKLYQAGKPYRDNSWL